MISLDDNRKLALQCLAAMDSPRYLEFLGDDATWEVVGPPEFPLAGIKTKPELEAVVRKFFAEITTPAAPRPVGITAEGERVAVEARTDLKLKDGRSYANRYHFLFIVRDGKVRRITEYVDTLLAQLVLFGAPVDKGSKP